jgi:hypothetical protein
VLYIALILPEKPVANDVLIEPKALDKIRHAYADDWQKCLDYISKA